MNRKDLKTNKPEKKQNENADSAKELSKNDKSEI